MKRRVQSGGDAAAAMDAPFQRRREGLFPFEFLLDFLRLLNRNRDLIEVITYDDLEWDGDADHEAGYPRERAAWERALRDGRRDPDKVYLLLQHDVDSHPERTLAAARAEAELGLRSNIMIFNRGVDRRTLAQRGEVTAGHYDLDRAALQQLCARGFVIGYHCNALERANFDAARAERIFLDDCAELATEFPLRYFSPHGGVRGPGGESNASIRLPEALRGRIRWVHNRYTVQFNGNYSDGGINGTKLDAARRDPRDFLRGWKRGARYRILFHPQYFHTPYKSMQGIGRARWYRELLELYAHGEAAGAAWPDELLQQARAPRRPYWVSAGLARARTLRGAARKLTPERIARSLRHRAGRLRDRLVGDLRRRAAPVVRRVPLPPRPILIGGDGRSGTTLLSVILDSHPQLAVGPELHFNGRQLPDLGPRVLACIEARGMARSTTAENAESRAARQFVSRCDRAGIPPAALADMIREAMAETGGPLAEFPARCALVRKLGEYNCARRGAGRWGFKIMREVKNLAPYGAVWPEAAFLHIIRDGRDVAASQIREHGSWGYRDTRAAAQGWKRVIEGARRSAAGLRYRELRYEDLVREPEATLRALLEWLGEAWHPAVLDHSRAGHALFESAVAHPSRAQVAEPINTRGIGRFRRELDAGQLRVFSEIAGGMLAELGYET